MKNIHIYNKSCNIVLQKLVEKKIQFDLILTDPPYIISRDSGYVNNAPDKKEYIAKYGKHKIDFGEWDKEELKLDKLFPLFYSLLKPSGTLLWFYDIWKMQEIKNIAEQCKFKQARLCQWVKNNPVPINSNLNYLSNAKEYFCTFVKKSKPIFNSKYDKGIYSYPICHGKERLKHPTQKPLKLIEELILKHSNENMIVLDPFMGSGTTGVACKNLNRKFIGVEIDENYFNIAEKRFLDN